MSKLKYYDGTNWVDVNGQITGDTLPIGAIVPYGSATAPTNWLVCDGSAVSRTTYAELFAVIGTSFGSGDGSTTFNLPNLKGRVAVGQDTNDTDFDTIGETGGEKTHTLTENEMPSHRHSNGSRKIEVAKGTSDYWDVPFSSQDLSYAFYTQNTGGGQAHNNLQPYQVVCYIIKAKQSAGVVANVSNTYSTSETDTYSCNYINNTTLYSDNTGTSGQIILNDNVSNYSYLEIYYNADGRHSSTKIPTSATQFTISLIYTGDNSYQYLFCTDCTISGNTINQNYARNNFISDQNNISSYGSTPYIKIYKVIGYK